MSVEPSDIVLPVDSGSSKDNSLSPTPPPKPKTRAPRHTTIAMQSWLEANDNNMYPSREQKLTLASTVNLPYNQINRWFANRRRRHAPKTELQAQLIRQNQNRNKRLLSPTSSSVSSCEMSTSDSPINKMSSFYAQQSHLASTPPAIQSLNPLLVQLQAMQQQQQHMPEQQSNAYLQLLQMQAPWLLQLQQQQAQQQQQRLLFDDVCQQQRVPAMGQDISPSLSSPQTPNNINSPSAHHTHFGQSTETSPSCSVEREDTYALFLRTAHARNLTDAESIAVCALADMARAKA